MIAEKTYFSTNLNDIRMMETKPGTERGLTQLCQVVNRKSGTRSGRGKDMNEEEIIAWLGLRKLQTSTSEVLLSVMISS